MLSVSKMPRSIRSVREYDLSTSIFSICWAFQAKTYYVLVQCTHNLPKKIMTILAYAQFTRTHYYLHTHYKRRIIRCRLDPNPDGWGHK